MRKVWAVPFLAIPLFMLTGGNASPADSVPLQIQVAEFLSLQASSSSMTLVFNNFTSGSMTNTVSMSYDVSSNNARQATNVFLANLTTLFPQIDLQADFASYANNGGNARLVEAASGFVTIGTTNTTLANKQTISSNGRTLIGTATVNYRAVAKADLEAGNQVGYLTITVVYS